MVNCGNLSKDSILTKMDEPIENSRAPENQSSPKLISFLYFWRNSSTTILKKHDDWSRFEDIWKHFICGLILFTSGYVVFGLMDDYRGWSSGSKLVELLGGNPGPHEEISLKGLSKFLSILLIPLFFWVYSFGFFRSMSDVKIRGRLISGWILALAILSPILIILMSALLIAFFGK